ncbi:MAG: hypothetical protein ABSH40_01585 [Bryobacteraceae bacterium]
MRKPEPLAKTPPRWLIPTLLSLTALFLIGLFSTEIADPDFWWHLKTGQYIVTRHRLPLPDPFAYTTASAPPVSPGEAATRRFNLTHEWLSQAVWYLVYGAGGFPAVVLWKALLLAAVCGFTGFVARQRTGSWLWGVAAALAAASLSTEFAKDRPGILSYVFTAGFIAIFEGRRRLWLLPVLSMLWANCHGGFFLGWMVCGAYCAEALLRRSADTRRVLLISGLAILLSGLNPNGFAAISAVLRYRQSPLQATLIEWSPADLWGSPYAFDLLLYAAALALLLSWKRVRPGDWLLFAAFGAAALTAFRNEMLIGLLAPMLIAAYFPWKRRLPAAVPFAAILLLAAATAWGAARRSFFQLRAAEWRYPAGAAAFLKTHNISAPLFNTYEYGGYLIWKDVPVFIDGRALSESVFQDYRAILGTPAADPARFALLARYHAGTILVNAFEYNAGTLYPLVVALAQPGEAAWKLVYEDPQSLLFLREVPSGLSTLDPRRILDHLDAECRLHISHDPDLSLCARTLGDFFLRTRDPQRARRSLELYLEHPYPGDTDARRAYLELLRH